MQLNGGMLERLKQFSYIDQSFIISDIVKWELIHYLSEKSFHAQEDLYKSFENFKDNSFINVYSEFTEYFDRLDKEEHVRLALEHFGYFLKSCDADEVASDNENDISEIFDAYFMGKPPFDTSKKKSEFPDAFALFSLERISEYDGCKVLVVSNDKGWQEFCENSRNLYYVDDIKKALSYFQKIDIEEIEIFQSEVISGEHEIINSKIKQALEDTYESTFLMIEADSSNPYELDVNEKEVLSFNYLEDIDFNVVEKHGDLIDITVSVVVELEIGVSVEFFVKDGIDKDFISINTQDVIRNVESFSTLVLTLRNFGAEIDVEDVEVIEFEDSFHLGEIEIEW